MNTDNKTALPNDAASVAFDLMEHIASREKPQPELHASRDYWLTLYRQCYKAARGDALQYVLERK
jgi:hypothetical protein